MQIENWFVNSRMAIKQSFNGDSDLFCRLLAGTSPISTIEANVKIAIRVYRHLKWFGIVPRGGLLGVHYISVNKLLSNPEKAGRKVWSLYQNLIGNEDVCPIDRWVKRYFGLPPERWISDKKYDELENKIREEARKLNTTASQRQLQIWCQSRENAINSIPTISYGDIILKDRITKEGVLARLI